MKSSNVSEGRVSKRLRGLFLLLPALALAACDSEPREPTITVTDETVVEEPHRLGVNMGMTTYFNDNQILGDPLVHGGFHKGRRVSLAQVEMVSGGRIRCSDGAISSTLQSDAFAGGTFWIGTGEAAGATGELGGIADGWLLVDAVPAGLGAGDWIWLRGAPEAVAQPVRVQGDTFLGIGDFRVTERGGTTSLVETVPGRSDLAFRVDGSLSGGDAILTHYVRLAAGGSYELRVRARGSLGSSWAVRLFRPGRDGEQSRAIPVTGSESPSYTWEDKAVPFRTPPDVEEGHSIWGLDLIATPGKEGDSFVEVDRIAFEGQPATPYGVDQRVVDVLREGRAGVLRFLGSATMGGIVEDITAASPAEASWTYYESNGGYALHRAFGVVDQWMSLCRDVGADAWIPVGGANTPADWYNLISYLAAPAGFDAYADARVDHGYSEPWTETVQIYLEPGNEWWNRVAPPYYLNDPEALGQVLSQLFQAAREHPHFDPTRIRLVAGGWATNPNRWTLPLHAATTGHDSIAIAPYFPSRLNDVSSDEAVIQGLFSETDAYLIYSGAETLRGLVGPDAPSLSVYEINQHLTDASVPVAFASRYCVSQVAAIAVLDRVLSVMETMKTDPIALFQLFQHSFRDRDGLWGLCIREYDDEITPRPLWLGLTMVNAFAIEGDMVGCAVTGGPVWDQVENGPIPTLRDVPALHAFAFRRAGANPGFNIVVVNRHLHETITARIVLPAEVEPRAERITLVGADPFSNNEEGQSVFIAGPDEVEFFGYYDAAPQSISILRVEFPDSEPDLSSRQD